MLSMTDITLGQQSKKSSIFVLEIPSPTFDQIINWEDLGDLNS